MTDNPRIAELRRRVDKDPTSIAFAQLAEEYRRMGDYKEAVKTCRDGLARHPGYVSAQVTLGRALVELGEYDEARKELEAVVRIAPDNLAAIRALADIHDRYGNVAAPVVADPVAAKPVVGQPVDEPPSLDLDLPSLEALDSPPMPDFSDWTLDTDRPMDLPELTFVDSPPETEHDDPVLEELEQWLTAIVADRAR